MERNQAELTFENERLAQTISLARKQLNRARELNKENESEILAAKEELRENTSHSISGLWSNEGFEALAELSQYASPITNKIADYEATETKILRLEKIMQSPYFARIDFRFGGENGYQKIYIGRASLMDEDSYEMAIYDWRAPIASVFYRFATGQAFYDAPDGRVTGEVGLKRQYEIENGKLAYFFDADVQIIDAFLRKLLSQNTSAGMKAIVETIQKEQDIVIRDIESDVMMVQGVAGSGKTSIALHRAAYLMYQGLASKLSTNNILIISPNALFKQYISKVLPELGEDNVVSMLFEEMVAQIVENEHLQSRNEYIENLLTPSPYRDTLKKSIAFKTSRSFMAILDRFIEDLPLKWIVFNDVYYNGKRIAGKEELKDRLLSGRKATPLGMRLKQLEDFILGLLQDTQKKRIGKSEQNMVISDIRAFTELDIENLYRTLISDKAYFYSLAEGLTLPDCTEDILLFTEENLSARALYYDDAIVLAYLHLKINGINAFKDIKQVVIDEAQDYYPLHYEICNLLFPSAQYTILGDINQTLEKQEDLPMYEQIACILNKKKASFVTMDKSYRCTNEILNYSSQFIDRNMEIKSFNREGDAPRVCAAPNPAVYSELIVSEVQACLEKGYKSIGLITKTEKNAGSLFARLKDKIDVRLITSRSATDLHGVLIIPVYMSKGLEFDAVIICDVDKGHYDTEDDKKLLYIACTRALHRLSLFCEGEMSRLVKVSEKAENSAGQTRE